MPIAFAYCLLPIAYCLLPLPIAYCLCPSPIPYCTIAYCLFPIPYSIPTSPVAASINATIKVEKEFSQYCQWLSRSVELWEKAMKAHQAK